MNYNDVTRSEEADILGLGFLFCFLFILTFRVLGFQRFRDIYEYTDVLIHLFKHYA